MTFLVLPNLCPTFQKLTTKLGLKSASYITEMQDFARFLGKSVVVEMHAFSNKRKNVLQLLGRNRHFCEKDFKHGTGRSNTSINKKAFFLPYVEVSALLIQQEFL